MNVALVMTVIGADRPGLVDSVAELVVTHGGNWLESRMAHLGGQFAGILRVQVPAARETALTQALRGLEAQGLTVVVHAEAAQPAPASPRLWQLELVGQDRPGIVRQISHALASHRVNVEEFTSECVSAAMSGEVLFKAQATIHVPSDCDLAALRRDLERIAADLIVDLSLKDLPAPPP